METLLADWLTSRPDLSPATHTDYRRSVGRFAKRHPVIGELTPVNTTRYVQECQARGKRHMASHDAVVLCLFARWLVEAGRLADDPLAGYKAPTQPKTRRQPFRDEDLPLIVQAAQRGRLGARNAAVVVLALASGLRLGELHALRWPEDVDLVGGFVYVRSGKSAAATRIVRLDPLASSTLAAFLAERRDAGPLFRQQNGRPLTYGGFRGIFAPIKKRLNGVNFMAHRCRNTAITNWLRAGTDLYTTMSLAGHTNPKVTVRYAGRLSEPDLVRLVKPGLSSVYSG